MIDETHQHEEKTDCDDDDWDASIRRQMAADQTFDIAWEAALENSDGCATCAHVHIIQSARLHLNGAMNEDARLSCPRCENPPPEGAIRFFKDGTDELL